jgi:DNA-binding PadR family transcriptional regulator
VLELAILGLLKEQDLHGYELKKRLGDTLGVVSGVSFGSLYPALARLEHAGAVHTVESVPVDAADPALAAEDKVVASRSRPPAPRGARSRKVYGITSRGEELFTELLAADTTSIEDSRVFHLRLAFARYLPPDARIGMLERRRGHLIDRLSGAGAKGRAGKRVDGYVRSLIEHDREATEHDLSWIERLIARERDVPAALGGGSQLPPPVTDAPTASVFQANRAPARPAPPIAAAAPTLSGLWRARGSGTNKISGPKAPSNQEESTS